MAGSGPFGGDPFELGDAWLAYSGVGGNDVNDDLELGTQNDVGIDDPGSNVATIITLNGPSNAAFAALNSGSAFDGLIPGQGGGIGVFGQSTALGIDDDLFSQQPEQPIPNPLPLTNGIGVAGYCSTGCGVYGQSLFGAGVVGFATIHSPWPQGQPLDEQQEPMGVFGVSEIGPGVRGHGGFAGVPDDPPSSNDFADASSRPGGVFSSGTLRRITTDGAPHLISKSSLPQLSLVPSYGGMGARFPDAGKVGDFFLAFNVDGAVADLYLCLRVEVDQQTKQARPIWSKVALVPGAQRGGDLIR